MFFRILSKRGGAGIEEVVKWLLYIAIAIAASFAIIRVVGRFG